MEGVENINSVNAGGISTTSTESQGTLNNPQQQTTADLKLQSMQAQNTTTTTAISNLASGQNDTEKKNHVFCYVVELTCIFSITTIKGVKMIKVVCETEEIVNKVMTKTIMVNNQIKFSKIESFTQNLPDLQFDFKIKIWDIPLDIEKDLFEQHLRSLGQKNGR
ncbi:hypothetical protein GLOIN_2v1778859 [Rhizophagus clarus]|uniref:Uncharacterized protein n=1 Tax=Rhizophagus clarus TaxID=94130 RepID=A0A8H3M600_9GLOM|nr:hypothetical protein GLOIN_2v1778859 [Rhizophagus clarus]